MKYYSVHFNRPDFLQIQKKYITDGELIVLNNHANKTIETACNNLNIKVINLQHEMRISPSHSHGHALNYLKEIIDYDDDYCIMDHDFFPFKKISLDDHDFISIKNYTSLNVLHMWPGLIVGKRGNSLKDINFMPGVISGGDTGCDTSRIINNKKIKFLEWKRIGVEREKYAQLSPLITVAEDFGVHYLNGSNWMPCDEKVIQEKNKLLISTLEALR